jgi:hypothetical protein
MGQTRRKPLKTTRTEAEVLTQVLQAASMLGLDLDRRNTGAGVNQAGKMVRFGKPGDSDLNGQIDRGPNAGRRIDVEIKREGFNPAKARGEERERFEKQLARLRRTNEQGGIAFWCDDSLDFIMIMQHVLAGARVHEPGYSRPTVYYPGEQP